MGNERRVLLAMWLTGGFMLVEVAGGVLSGSLALIADAGHMLTDTGALLLAWAAIRFARKPADDARSYSYHRGEILAAFLNGVVMIALAIWIVIEAVERIFIPSPVLADTMLVVAIAGLAVNIFSFWLLHGAEDSLNIRGAAVHVLGDLLGSVAAIIGALVIMFTGFFPIDPLLSMLVAALILRSAWNVTRDSAHVLMEGTPTGLEPDTIANDLITHVPGVTNVHHVHAWSLGAGNLVVTLHAKLQNGADTAATLSALKARLQEKFGIDHATIQIEAGECLDPAH
jgi:cobalt-zinc-cadmium efflux system protein